MNIKPDNTLPLNKSEKETLRDWLFGHIVRDEETGEVIHHRIWFKMLFNPFLRKHGWVIATEMDDNDNVIGYTVRKYDKVNWKIGNKIVGTPGTYNEK